MKPGTLAFAFFAAATLILPAQAGTEPHVSISSLKEVERYTDKQFAVDPWEMLGDTRGTYLPGFGAVFTFEMSLVNVMPLNPFQMTVSPEQVKTIHERKVKQLNILRDTMRELLVRAATTLTALPGNENVVIEAHLLSQPFEDQTGLPWRLTMTAPRQKLLDAAARHATPADLAAIIGERRE